MLINLSNHPSEKWSNEQLDAANNQFGGVVDISFPNVDPEGDEEYINELADKYLDIILNNVEKFEQENPQVPTAVHIMGEMNLTYALVYTLSCANIPCVASTTKREVVDLPDGRKESSFKFVHFREYTYPIYDDYEY